MNKKGFTLIELLAIIVIIAILSVITIPIVLKVMDNAKKATAEESTNNVIKAAKLNYANNLENKKEEKIYTCDGEKCSYTQENNDGVVEILNISGTIPQSGYVKIKEDGNVEISNLEMGEYICNIKGKRAECIETIKINKLFYLDIPYKENMTYYFDYNSNVGNEIENYSSGKRR